MREASTRYFLFSYMLVVLCTAGAEAATVAGVVRDAKGNPIAGAQIKLVNQQAPEIVVRVNSGKDGTYRFIEVVPGRYQLSAEQIGYGVATPSMVTVSTPAASVDADLSLTRLPPEGDPTPSQPRLKFEAAGVRGLIDPGGYSASANAASASELISGIADIKRAENLTDSAPTKDLPCGLEPQLTKDATTNPLSSEANRLLGEFYLAHGSATQAILYLSRARQIDSADARTSMELSEALLINAQFEAARDLLLGLPADKRNPGFYRLLARTEEGAGHFVQASEQYQIAADKNPSEENIFGVGYELILAGRPADAAKVFTVGMTRYPHSVTLLIGAGTADFLQGRSSTAVTFFLQAIGLDPSDSRPYSFLMGAFAISGDQAEQVRARLKHYLELSPNNAEAYYFYALALLHGNPENEVIDYDRIESLLWRAIMLDPNLASAHFQLGILSAHREDYKDAVQQFEATTRLAPGMKEAHYRLAFAYKKTGNEEAAEREMRLFREARESSRVQNGESEISIEEFVSVVNRPGRPVANDRNCPQNPPD